MVFLAKILVEQLVDRRRDAAKLDSDSGTTHARRVQPANLAITGVFQLREFAASLHDGTVPGFSQFERRSPIVH